MAPARGATQIFATGSMRDLARRRHGDRSPTVTATVCLACCCWRAAHAAGRPTRSTVVSPIATAVGHGLADGYDMRRGEDLGHALHLANSGQCRIAACREVPEQQSTARPPRCFAPTAASGGRRRVPAGSARQSRKWGFGAAPPIVAAVTRLTADAAFGYLPPQLADDLAARAPTSSSAGTGGRSILGPSIRSLT